MTEKLDYKKIGLKSGIEIHQRLATGKLFCSCPSILRDDKPDFTIRREIRAVAGETGAVDVAAQHEQDKDVYFLYEGYNDTTCLVEIDEEPPHPMDSEALQVVLQICKMLDADFVDEIQVMRKTVTNGSNTSGFQRTALVGFGGTLKTPQGPIGIPNIQIEEEAAKDIAKGIDKNGKRFVTFRLDRLGIPLIELGTDPDMKTPEQCKEVCERMGMILRSTGKVARGIGTIRQDVNISIKGGNRIEIKGAQDLKTIPIWVDYEARRQLALIAVAEKVKGLKVTHNSKDLTGVFKNTACVFVKKAIDKKHVVLGSCLSGFDGILGTETAPSKRIGSEMSDYAKVKAGVGGIIHSDEKLEKYKFSEDEIKAVKKNLGCNKKDAFILVVAEKPDAEKAIRAALDRASLLKKGVLMEVRKPNPDGTTSFMRPMPGAARMYPETDVPPIRPDLTNIELPELIEDKIKRYRSEFKLSPDLARDIARSNHLLFEESVAKFKNIKPAFIGETIISLPKTIKRKQNLDTDKIKDQDFRGIFTRLDDGRLTKDSIETILIELAKGKGVIYENFAPLSDKDLETEIGRILKESKELKFNILVNKVMGSLKGKAEGKKIIDMLKKLTK
ncbi:Glu-tRNA(Gln) amidotransferase subunit GatE [Nanoarchaeota archaeon]